MNAGMRYGDALDVEIPEILALEIHHILALHMNAGMKHAVTV